MDLQAIERDLQHCACGREHKIEVKAVEIGSGLVRQAGEILAKRGFPRKFLLVSDQNAMRVSKGIRESLSGSGFEYREKIYDNMLYAMMDTVKELELECDGCDAILSVGTGSVNDVCRLAAYNKKIDFAIFATAPSMDGFASDTSPIIKNCYKKSYQAASPSIIIADTKILAASPVELKAAGLGDLLAKYVALVDWRVAHLVIGEYYCEKLAKLTTMAVDRAVELADKITQADEETAAAIMEALVFTGIAMQLAGCSRPASGSEHLVSHFWEDNKVKNGIWPDYHGKKVGVATCLVVRRYNKLAEIEAIDPKKEVIDWDELKEVYADFIEEIKAANNPQIMDEVDVGLLKTQWPQIRKIIRETLPSTESLVALMKRAGAATTPEETDVDEKMEREAMEYSPYMRHRLTLLRLCRTLNVKLL